MPTRQSLSIRRIRAERRESGLCADCAVPSASYRCPACQQRISPSKAYMRAYMRSRRAKVDGAVTSHGSSEK